MKYILVILISYLLGSSSMSFYLSRWKNVNLRDKGSKNLGASNTVVLMGWKYGALVAIHDIGKAVDQEQEGPHALIGGDIAKKYHESSVVVNAIAAHHGDVEMESLEAILVQAADAISAARPGARRETLEAYIKRLQNLEEIADSFEGVEKSFAIQAGREVRIVVKPERITDDQMTILARDVAKKVEDEMDYPGQIKVNIIRETRVVDYAK